MSEGLKSSLLLTNRNIINAVAVSKRFEGNLIRYTRKRVPKSENHFAKEPKTQKM